MPGATSNAGLETARELPKVSCLMVTADRMQLCKRAVLCYTRQTYPNKELVVVDDGAQDLEPVLRDLPSDEVRYVKLPPSSENVLGALRNKALDAADGEILAQWDDDDWYHPDRLAKQVSVILDGFEACTLSGTLVHLATDYFFDHPYVGYLKNGVPGSIVHRRDDEIRYPEMRRAEDDVYLKAWSERAHTKLSASDVHLFIRCFHGENTWEQAHFQTRMRNTFADLVSYVWHRYLRGDLFQHNRFQLSDQARTAFESYLADSRRLDLLVPPEN